MRLAIQGAWVAENIRRLGSGAFYHLSYPTHQVHPQLLHKLKTETIRYGPVGIYVLRDEQGFQIADGELVAIHRFPEFIRIHFMIGNVYVHAPGPVIAWPDARRYVLT